MDPSGEETTRRELSLPSSNIAILPLVSPMYVLTVRCQRLWWGVPRSAQRQRGARPVRPAQYSGTRAGAQSARWQLPGQADAAATGRLSDAASSVAARHRVSDH